LITANKELVLQNIEKEKRAVELAGLYESLRTHVRKQLRLSNDLLIIQEGKSKGNE
jgi:hypothetical protein